MGLEENENSLWDFSDPGGSLWLSSVGQQYIQLIVEAN
jgi:hypothetical protein